MRQIAAGMLDFGYRENGPDTGTPVVLLHGFPYDGHGYEAVAAGLADRRVIVPWLRGYGPTRFRSAATMRSGQQAVLGMDLLALLDGLGVRRAVLVGYDWGGRAASIVAALWPERVAGLLTCDGYAIQDIAAGGTPKPPETERALWYQHVFQTDRGRAGLERDRRAFCRLLWRSWSPGWRFDDATFERSAASFDNPDFVDVVIHSYRHRFGLAAGDPAADGVEGLLASQPRIAAPTIVLHGEADGVAPPGSLEGDERHFDGPYERRILEGVGHNPPQEAPDATVAAIRSLLPD